MGRFLQFVAAPQFQELHIPLQYKSPLRKVYLDMGTWSDNGLARNKRNFNYNTDINNSTTIIQFFSVNTFFSVSLSPVLQFNTTVTGLETTATMYFL
jgi:hypothetical protein